MNSDPSSWELTTTYRPRHTAGDKHIKPDNGRDRFDRDQLAMQAGCEGLSDFGAPAEERLVRNVDVP
jgi:hypothetical protein